MELRQLAIFVAVVEQGSFTAAAKRLGLVQSATSTTVRTLERELDERLFERTTRRVELTDAGRALLPEARKALAAADAAREAVDAVRGGLRGAVRLGTMHARILGPIRIPALLADFRAEHPHVEIRLLHGPSSMEKLGQVRDGQLDLALVGLASPPPAGVEYVGLSSEPMQLACHHGHALAHRDSVDIGSLIKETFVDGPPGSASRVTTDAAFAALGLTRTVAYEINDTSGMVDLISAGLAVAILPPRVARDGDAVRFIPFAAGAPTFHLSLALPANRPLGAAARELGARIRVQASAPPPH
jgi:DNA-binding transcriptional LysR family regulator